MTRPTCCWVLRPASKDEPALYCGKRIKMTRPIDPESGLRHNVYAPFCYEHQQRVDAERDNDE